MTIDEGAAVDTPDDDPSLAPPGTAPTRWWTPERSGRVAAGVFGAYLVVAFLLLVFRWGPEYWFAGDDWGMIIDRTPLSPRDLVRPQNGHWSLIPTVSYGALFRVFGLHSYAPYQTLTILLHLSLATLIRMTMRRAGVGPWVATIVAGSFVLYGTAEKNMLQAIQISMVATLVFGWIHLLLADHDGPPDRRDALGLGAGVVALMASGIAPCMVLIVGVATFIRRGWRMAALHTAPLGAVWVLWWALSRNMASGQSRTRFVAEAMRDWVASGETGVFMALGQYRWAAIGIAVVLAVGLALAWAPLDLASLRRRAAVPAALLIGSPLLFALISSQRWNFPADVARSSRYMAMSSAFLLPAFGVAVAAIVKRWRVAAPVVLLPLVVGVPGNIDALESARTMNRSFYENQRSFVLNAAYRPLVDEVGRDVLPNPNQLGPAEVDTGFLIAARERGRLPDAPETDQEALESIDLRLMLSQAPVGTPTPAELRCRYQQDPVEFEARKGDRFGLTGPVRITRLEDGEPVGPAVGYNTSWSSRVLEVQVPELSFRVSGPRASERFGFCS